MARARMKHPLRLIELTSCRCVTDDMDSEAQT
jgi:hypothetical protein